LTEKTFEINQMEFKGCYIYNGMVLAGGKAPLCVSALGYGY